MSYTVLIPAAGKSERFKNVGISKPKGLLQMEWRDRTATMIEHVMPRNNSPVRIGCRAEDHTHFERSLAHIRKELWPIVATHGQSHTCAQMSKGIDGPVLVINSDNGFDCDLDEFFSECVRTDANAGAVVFISNGERKYGYVNEIPWFTFALEKAPISTYALAGAFYFKSAMVLQLAHSLTFKNNLSEQYLSEIFKVIPHGKLAYRIPRSELHEWGTPIDLLADASVKVVDEEWSKRRMAV